MAKTAGSSYKVAKGKKRGSYKKSYNKHSQRPKSSRGQGT